ncbi:MAG: indole-3-glycerol phosphate synthase TrpC [candidate division WOR-3 bacterium]|nr:indole-3-glycerol phosphate synthase TrpC [candidate division WOR-3 bacterium]
MNILGEIVEDTKRVVAEKKISKPLKNLVDCEVESTRNFEEIFKKNQMALIAEIKRASPSTGIIRKDFDPIQIGIIYETAGVDAVSVVTNRRFFGGRLEDIALLKQKIHLPLLCKDFIIDEYQLYESRLYGADAVLFIARILDGEELKSFVAIAHKLGMATIVEVHDREDVAKALNTATRIIGINNRNLDDFTVDIRISLSLKPFIPKEYYTLSESGIKDRLDVKILLEAGFDGILVGTSILKADDIEKKIQELKWIG